MIKVVSFCFNPFQENTYLLIDESGRDCLIVDPGMYEPSEYDQFYNYLTTNNLTPRKIINTHAHIDHIFGVQALKERFNIPFGLHARELPVLSGAAGSAQLFGFSLSSVPEVDFTIPEDETISFGLSQIQVKLTPGHSPGSITFYQPESRWVLSGDVLFQGSIGRTDLPGGSTETLMNSIRQELYTLPDNTAVYPGHGAMTNIGIEKMTNPFIKA